MTTIKSRVVIVEDSYIALIRRMRDGQTYYLFPGGGVETGETAEDAAKREAFEELGVVVQILQLIARADFGDTGQLYFLAKIIGGTFGSGAGAELASSTESANGGYAPEWLPIPELAWKDVRPRSLAERIWAVGEVWWHEVLEITD